MPLYEYRCKSCDQVFETLRSASASGAAECPHCQGTETMRLLSVFAAQSPQGAGQGMMRSAPAGGCCGGGCGCR